MDNLISRKALKSELQKREWEFCFPLIEIDEVIDEMPAVDAEPVRRARWKAANRRGTLCDTYICSECGNMVMQAEGFTYSCTCNYCPNCGAKMDEEGK